MFDDGDKQTLQLMKSHRFQTYLDIGLYFLFLILGRDPFDRKKKFPRARTKFLFARLLFLNLGLAGIFVVTERELNFKKYLAEKYMV
eukprot:CAMPEP_0170560572 /NCGR_PEP_ID=MMETSP0211-20121228/49699_1 /TAXON_ID=311385 /ORGANISM="Pseudokeronopsis sp., Strain OXSARD2" /LENGTH=86 /DNA_ID=CAMNT_0010874927 /DNA_START=418 /DNA_END=675 /DNA_ORIENTATION=-